MIQVVAEDARRVHGLIENGRVVVPADALAEILGWELKPEGLCRDDQCAPVAPGSLQADGGIDLLAAADALGRPGLVDPETESVAIGAARPDRRAALVDRQAPDFTLPDLDGVPRALSDWTGRKRLLVAFASW